MKAIRPRESRLFIDDVRSAFLRNPFVLKVLSRESDGGMKVIPYEIKSFDIEFANNFFYVNDLPDSPNPGSPVRPSMLMVPFNLNGDE